jgi:hypothetical protein
MGNVSMGTQAYQNTSAFQHHTSPSYSASQFRALSPHGVEQSTFADGSQSLQNQALSRLSVQIMGTENTSFAQQQSLNEAMSVMQSKSFAASKATETALQETTNFLSSVGKAISSGEDFHQGTNASNGKIFQNFKNFVHDIQQTTGLNEAQAVEAAVGASSGALQLLGVDIRGGFSTSAARNQAIASAKSIANQTNYSESFDKVISSAQSFAETHHDTKNAELGRSATSSLNQAKSLRDELSVAQNKVETISNDISSAHGKSLSINKDLTQDVLDFIAHQPVNAGPIEWGPNGPSQGVIGHEGARRIMEVNGAEAQAYYERFQQENPQYTIEGINTSQHLTRLSSKFDSESGKLMAGSVVATQHGNNTDNVLSQAKEKQLEPHLTPESRKSEIMGSLNQQDATIEQKKRIIDEHEQKLQEAEKESKNQTLVGAAASSTWASLTPEKSMLQIAQEKDRNNQFLLAALQQKKGQIFEKAPSPANLIGGEVEHPPLPLTSGVKSQLEQEGNEDQRLQIGQTEKDKLANLTLTSSKIKN